MDDSKYKTFSQTYRITDDYFLSDNANIFDIGKLIEHTLYLSGEHDQFLQQEVNVKIISDEETWVITQYYIKQLQMPALNDQITVRTRVVDANRFFITRYFDIYNDEQLLFEVFTQYTVINWQTRKMVRIDVEPLERMDLVDKELTIPFKRFVKPDEFESYLFSERDIHDSDIDENNHVNNLVYINWAFSSLPKDFITQHTIDTIEVKYGKELFKDNQVGIESYRLKPHLNQTETYQIIKDKATDKDASYVRINWKPVEN